MILQWFLPLIALGQSLRTEETDLWNRRIQVPPMRIPSYPYTLSYVLDGFNGFLESPDVFRLHNLLLGRSYPEGAVAEGRRAAAFFKSMYGVDFTHLPDRAFLTGNTTLYDGRATFHHWMLDIRGLYRVISLTDLSSATRFNNYISDGGWLVRFNAPWRSTGKINRVLPAGTFGVYGNYGIRTGVNGDKGYKQDNAFPGPVLNIHYESREAFFPPDRDSRAQAIDCVVSNEFLGRGLARGVLIPLVEDVRDIDGSTLWTGSNILTFPATNPFNANSY